MAKYAPTCRLVTNVSGIADCVVVDAGMYEPVSGAEIPVFRENTGKYRRFQRVLIGEPATS
jgi:hypothetical protein